MPGAPIERPQNPQKPREAFPPVKTVEGLVSVGGEPEKHAWNALIALTHERKTIPDTEKVIVSWLTTELSDGKEIRIEMNGAITRGQLAQAIQEGLRLPDAESRSKIGIPVADSGPHCIFYPFVSSFEYHNPGLWSEVSPGASALHAMFNEIAEQGRAVRSEIVPGAYVYPSFLNNINRDMAQSPKFYKDLLRSWSDESDTVH